MNHTRIIALLFAALVVFAGVAPASASEKVSIADIQEEIAGGWHETYEVNGRTIAVDVDVEVPDVDTVPILRVGYTPTMEPIGPYEDMVSDIFGIALVAESSPGVYRGDGDAFEITDDEARAENNPLSPQDAQSFAEGLLKQYESQIGPLDLRLYACLVKSRVYAREKRDGDLTDLNLQKPSSEMGTYTFAYDQYLHGIPLANTQPLFTSVPINYEIMIPGGPIYAEVATQNDYSLQLCPVIEKETISEDVSMVSFETVRSEFEALINAGLLREVHSIRLMYYCYIDSKNVGESFILKPVWVVRGSVVENASHPDPEEHEFTPEYSKYWSSPVIVDAVSGELLGSQENWQYAD